LQTNSPIDNQEEIQISSRRPRQKRRLGNIESSEKKRRKKKEKEQERRNVRRRRRRRTRSQLISLISFFSCSFQSFWFF